MGIATEDNKITVTTQRDLHLLITLCVYKEKVIFIHILKQIPMFICSYLK